MLGRKLRKIILQKNQTSDILQCLRLRIGFQPLFHEQASHPGNRCIVISHISQNFFSCIRMKCIQPGPPAVITDSIHCKQIAGNFPSADMLSPASQP